MRWSRLGDNRRSIAVPSSPSHPPLRLTLSALRALFSMPRSASSSLMSPLTVRLSWLSIMYCIASSQVPVLATGSAPGTSMKGAQHGTLGHAPPGGHRKLRGCCADEQLPSQIFLPSCFSAVQNAGRSPAPSSEGFPHSAMPALVIRETEEYIGTCNQFFIQTRRNYDVLACKKEKIPAFNPGKRFKRRKPDSRVYNLQTCIGAV